MRLFARSETSFSDGPTPWWRAMSLGGWGIIFLATFALVGFCFGLMAGEVPFLPSYKAKSGPASFSWSSSPVLFSLAMMFNLVVGICIWVLFVKSASYTLRSSQIGRSTRGLPTEYERNKVQPEDRRSDVIAQKSR